MIPLDSVKHIKIPELIVPKKHFNLLLFLLLFTVIGGITFLIIKNKSNETTKPA